VTAARASVVFHTYHARDETRWLGEHSRAGVLSKLRHMRFRIRTDESLVDSESTPQVTERPFAQWFTVLMLLRLLRRVAALRRRAAADN
jgi:hypothetical protein